MYKGTLRKDGFYKYMCMLLSEQAAAHIKGLYDIFLKYDCTLIEINPMAEDAGGQGT